MSQPYYIYYVSITDIDKVRVRKQGPKRAMGVLSGRFDYAAQEDYLHTWLEEARLNRLTGSQIQDFGQRLFTVLFDEKLRHNFLSFYEEVMQNEKALLRIELDVDESKLPHIAALPWELMQIPDNSGHGTVYLSTHPHLILSRRRGRENPPRSLHLANDEQLRIVLAVATPSKSEDTKLGPVEYKTIWQRLEELRQVKLINCKLIKDATEASLNEALKEMEPHIFHFIGHARLKDIHQRDKGEVALTHPYLPDEADWVGAKYFSDLFNQYRPRVVFLQACESGALSASDAFVGVASQVVEQNIPIVVAMQYKVSNAVAQSFALKFYHSIIESGKVDLAVQEGRRYITHEYGLEQRHFATPVLFMCVDDGQILPPERQIILSQGRLSVAGIIHLAKLHKHYLKLRRFRQPLQIEYNFFSTQQKIRVSKCEGLEKLLTNVQKFVLELHSVLVHPPEAKLVPHYTDTDELNHANDTLIVLLKLLKVFCPTCPPLSYHQDSIYDEKRASICTMLNSLLDNTDKAISFLQDYLGTT